MSRLGMTSDDWRALITVLVLIGNAVNGYILYLQHRNGNGKG